MQKRPLRKPMRSRTALEVVTSSKMVGIEVVITLEVAVVSEAAAEDTATMKETMMAMACTLQLSTTRTHLTIKMNSVGSRVTLTTKPTRTLTTPCSVTKLPSLLLL